MNELVKITSAISNCKSNEVIPQIMAMCRTITPQFYRGMTDIDLKTEKMGIELMISNIEQPCLSKMCELAVLNYARFRSENSKVYFDINYILTFYKQAFNQLYCYSKFLPKHSTREKWGYNYETHIISETWKSPDGKVIEIMEIMDKPKSSSEQRIYSTKYHENIIYDLEEIEI